ncbi:hypothetical protein PsYK624_108010 [Phanerochaete sordida]|uniref:DUF7702 domain-containing protein n=1 Tax=Phanerochaete sordida TaxID=48140 RepID=A0A9P3LGS9_9APHY|nr:hypothetical protein PsYK624_108010 [Phanerochaete sordida]
MSSSSINYAREEGIAHSELPAAIVFAGLYVLLLSVFAVLIFKRPAFAWRFLTVFSVVRATAFTLRSVLAGSATAGTNLNLFVAESVIYGVGFFGLLYSAYTLVLDRDDMVNSGKEKRQLPGPLALFSKVARTRILVRALLMGAVVLGIVAGVKQGDSDSSSQATGNSLRKVSIVIFLVVSCMLLFVTLLLAADEHRSGALYEVAPTLGRRYGVFMLFAIAALCIVREAFLVATLGNTQKQNQASLFYPLAATPELIAALLFLVPGLVPSKLEMDARRDQARGAQNGRGAYSMSTMAPQAYGTDSRFAPPV